MAWLLHGSCARGSFGLTGFSDICTKSLNAEAAERHVRTMGYEVLAGRSTAAKSLVT